MEGEGSLLLLGACLIVDGEKGPHEGLISQLRHEWWAWTSQTKRVEVDGRRETEAHWKKWGKFNLAETQARGGQVWSWCLAAPSFPRFQESKILRLCNSGHLWFNSSPLLRFLLIELPRFCEYTFLSLWLAGTMSLPPIFTAAWPCLGLFLC